MGLFAGAGLGLPLAGCAEEDWYGVDVSGAVPDLAFRFTETGSGRKVTEADYRGQVVAMFFGYTFCPDICPMTLSNVTAVAEALGERAEGLTVLFVTVDPQRDTPDFLARYVGHFTDRARGLRGTDNELAAVARRYRVTYKIADHAPGAENYEVSHGKSVYIFDGSGKARLLWPSFDTMQADLKAGTRDLERLISQA